MNLSRVFGASGAMALAASLWLVPSASARPAADVSLPAGFEVSVVARPFDLPVAVRFLPDGRALVAEKSGLVKLLDGNRISAKPVIDLRDSVNDFVDRGLLGLAIDPNFTANGYVYLLYAHDAPGDERDVDGPRMGRLARYTMKDDVIAPASGMVLLDDFESATQNHSVGDLKFSTDGALFVSLGDGSLSSMAQPIALRSQDLNNAAGKVLRIDPMTGHGLPDNPYFDAATPHSAMSRVWARGFRNPYRMGVDPNTGLPLVGNVGWFTYESLNVARPGDNFGWPCTEGRLNRPEFQSYPQCADVQVWNVTPGDYEYPHAGNNASLTAGDFNIGPNFPADMRGDFFFGDYSLQWMKRATMKGDKIASVQPFGEGLGEIADMVFSPEGELYFIPLYSGEIRKVGYAPGYRRAFTPTLTASCATPCNTLAGGVAGRAPLTVTFSAAGTHNPNGENLEFGMTFGDEPFARRPARSQPVTFTQALTFSHVYTREGAFVARLFARNDAGAMPIAEMKVEVGKSEPSARIVLPGDKSEFLPGQTLVFAGEARDAFGNAAASPRWVALLVEPERVRVLGVERAATMTVTVPNDAGPDARIHAGFIADTADGNASSRLIQLYAKPSDGYVRSWWLTGAYQYPSVDRPLDPDALDYLGGEANFVAPRDDDAAQLIRSPARNVNFSDFVSPAYRSEAYAFVWIDSPEDRKALLGMNSDDGIAVWLNGQRVWFNNVSRFMPNDTRDIDLPPINLKKGKNALLVKVSQNDGDWQFKLRVLNPDGSVMRDVVAVTQ